MRAGRLREQVTIQANRIVRAGTGNDEQWDDVATVRAEVIPINGGEAFRAGIERQTQFYRVTMYFRADVTPNHRLMWNGLALNIRTCGDPDDCRQQIVITAESGVPT